MFSSSDMATSYPLGVLEQMTFAFQHDFGLYMVFAALVFGFLLSFAVGANDAANSWGAPVGAGTVSLGVAFFLGSIMEILGSVYLSEEVVSTVAGDKSVVKMELYKSENITECTNFMEHKETLLNERVLMLGLVTSMIASQLWQMIATYLACPVSGTHTIISALMGFTLVEKGAEGLNVGSLESGSGIFKVLHGLVISPLLSLIMSFILYFLLYKFAVKKRDPRKILSKLFYSFCVFLIVMAVTFTFTNMLKFESLKVEGKIMNKKVFSLILGTLVGFLCSCLFFFFIIPELLKMRGDLRITFQIFSKKKEEKEMSEHFELVARGEESKSKRKTSNNDEDESDDVKRIFRPLQVLAACFGALTHGSNDVGNCIGPLVTIWYLYKTPINYSTDTPLYGILLWGGIGISLGLVCFGKRVIVTIGSKISQITPSLGFTVVLTASIVVMVCSLTGIPTSTTHCQVMGVVGAGLAKGWVDKGAFRDGLETINFSLIGHIALAWISTIPFAFTLSAILYAVVRVIIIGPY